MALMRYCAGGTSAVIDGRCRRGLLFFVINLIISPSVVWAIALTTGLNPSVEEASVMTIGRTSKKSRQQDQLILALLEHPGREKAAARAGVSPTTAWRIMKTPEFEEAYRLAHQEVYSQSIARLHQASTDAVSILLEIMRDPKVFAACRLRAVSNVLVLGAKGTEIEDVKARLSRLEKAPETTNPGVNQP
jgi:hypothetical protein